eukprot:2432386-Amphidinium_carterae.1
MRSFTDRLAPLPGQVRASSMAASGSGEHPVGGKRKLQRDSANFREQVKKVRSDAGEMKNKPSGAAKAKAKKPATPEPRMPRELVGLRPNDPNGQRYCYGFNLGECSKGDCTRGMHKCMRCGSANHGA